MTTTSHTLVVTLDGTDRSAAVLRDSLFVRTSLQSLSSVCDVTFDGSIVTPAAWDPVTVVVNGTTVFGGYVTGRTAEVAGVGSQARALWRCECRDWSVLFDRVLVDVAYNDLSDRAILQNLFNTYLGSDGFDVTTHTEALRYGIDIGFVRVSLREAMNTLAKQTNATWFVDAAKNLYWFDRWSPPAAAFSLDAATPNESTTFAPLWNTLRREIDDTTPVNRVTVIGAERMDYTALTYDIYYPSGGQTSFALSARPHTLLSVGFYVGPGESNYVYQQKGDRFVFAPGTFEMDGGRAWVIVDRDAKRAAVRYGTEGVAPSAYGQFTIVYYPVAQDSVTVDDETSQTFYGRVFEQQVYAPDLVNVDDMTAYANSVLRALQSEKETIKFDVAEHGLLPGTLLEVTAATLGITAADTSALDLESTDEVLLESGSVTYLERSRLTGRYLIQEVALRPVVTTGGTFMIVASVTAGEAERSLLDLLAKTVGTSGAGVLYAPSVGRRLSDISADLGEVIAGRAVLTDGGTARFTWDNYHQHSGVVAGLDDSDSRPYGSLVVLDQGNRKVKLGKLDGEDAIAGVTPAGWGIYTTNGYFQGQVAATSLVGGTVAGALIYGGTIRTSANLVNSANPGVTMDSSGLYGYGTAGLTFALYSDPALKPYFSSGTITNVVYEVTTQSVIRTGTVNPRVQIDNSGIFAYNSAGANTFQVDVATGLMAAVGGTFSGSVSASTVTGGTVTGSYITGGTVNAAAFTGNTFTGNTFSGGTVTGAQVIGGTLKSERASYGTVIIGSGSVVMEKGRIVVDSPTAIPDYYIGGEDGGITFGNYDSVLNGVSWITSTTLRHASIYGHVTGGTSALVLKSGSGSTDAYMQAAAGVTNIELIEASKTVVVDSGAALGFGEIQLQQDTQVTGAIYPAGTTAFYSLGNASKPWNSLKLVDINTGATRTVTVVGGVLTVV